MVGSSNQSVPDMASDMLFLGNFDAREGLRGDKMQHWTCCVAPKPVGSINEKAHMSHEMASVYACMFGHIVFHSC